MIPAAIDAQDQSATAIGPRGPEGICIDPMEHGEIGPDLFRAACNMG
jgi:hypothetical protein